MAAYFNKAWKLTYELTVTMLERAKIAAYFNEPWKLTYELTVTMPE